MDQPVPGLDRPENYDQALRAADQGLRAALASENRETVVLALFARFGALFGQEDYREALQVIRQVIGHAAVAMMPPHILGQFLAESATALRAAGHPEVEHRAALLSAVDAFDQAGLADLAQTFRQIATGGST